MNNTLNSWFTDCVLIAAIVDDGYSCIISDSCEFIPSPPVSGNRAVTEKQDLYFGQDDYLVWPQPYNSSLPHLPFIRRREVEIKDSKRSFLWLLPSRYEFCLHAPESYTGLGKLAPYTLDAFKVFWDELNVCIYKEIPDNVPHLMNRLMAEITPLFNRLEYLLMGYNAMCHTVRALQRNIIEVEAFTDYLVLQRHIQHDPASVSSFSSSTAIARVGAFVYSMGDMTSLRQMGIYHWLICPLENVSTSRIHKVVPMQHPDQLDLSTEPSSESNIIFVSAASDPAMYRAISNYGRNYIRFPDPFHAKAVPEPLRVSSGPVRIAVGRQRALTPKQRAKKFASNRKFKSNSFTL